MTHGRDGGRDGGRVLDHGALLRPSLRMRAATRDEPVSLVVPREAHGARLDRFLVAALTALPEPPSRATVQRWIDDGRVLVDGDVLHDADHKVTDGARIRVHPAPPPPSEAEPDPSVCFDVLHVDDDIIVLDKPPGLVVHPGRGHESGTLVNGLLAMGAFDVPASEVADSQDPMGPSRPGIVHRLDKGTSGVMVVARTGVAREHLKMQFAEHTIGRAYVAICVGDVPERRHESLHGRHPTDRLRFTGRVREGKRAVTEVRVLEPLAGGRATHVECRLETGRTHQIRVHLSESGNPILGDPLYGRPLSVMPLRAIADALGRQALHARLLELTHPTTGERLTFESQPPSDYAAALAALRA